MFCRYHPQRIALEKCDRCQSPVCKECAALVQGKTYCHHCSNFVGEGAEILAPRKPLFAAILSLLFPGMGQCYNGQLMKGLLVFITSVLIFPWIYGVYDAYTTADLMNKGQLRLTGATISFRACLLIIAVLLAIPFLGYQSFDHYLNITNTPRRGPSPVETLKYISDAIENYAQKNGEYPSNSNVLYFADPPYLDEIYCNIERDGFHFSCFMSNSGYRIIATPVKIEEDRIYTTYSIATGGVLSPEE